MTEGQDRHGGVVIYPLSDFQLAENHRGSTTLQWTATEREYLPPSVVYGHRKARASLYLASAPPAHLRCTHHSKRGEGDLLVIQAGSTIGTKPEHRAILRSLGLRGIGQRRLHRGDRQEILSQIDKVHHLVDVHPVAAYGAEPASADPRQMNKTLFEIEGQPARRITFSGSSEFVQVELYDGYYTLTWSSHQSAAASFLALEAMFDHFADMAGDGIYHGIQDQDFVRVGAAKCLRETRTNASLDFARVDFDRLAIVWTKGDGDAPAPHQIGVIATSYDAELIIRLLRATGSKSVSRRARDIARDDIGYIATHLPSAPIWRD